MNATENKKKKGSNNYVFTMAVLQSLYFPRKLLLSIPEIFHVNSIIDACCSLGELEIRTSETAELKIKLLE